MVRKWRANHNKPTWSIYKYAKIAAKELGRIMSNKNRLHQVLQMVIKNKHDPDFAEFGQAQLLNNLEQTIEHLERVYITLAGKRYKAGRSKMEKGKPIHAQT